MNQWIANSANWQEAQNFSISSGDSGAISSIFNWRENPNIYSDNYWTYPDIYHYYYYWYYPALEIRYEKSKIDMAFKIVQILIDKKIIDINKLSVGKFIILVNEIAKEI